MAGCREQHVRERAKHVRADRLALIGPDEHAHGLPGGGRYREVVRPESHQALDIADLGGGDTVEAGGEFGEVDPGGRVHAARRVRRWVLLHRRTGPGAHLLGWLLAGLLARHLQVTKRGQRLGGRRKVRAVEKGALGLKVSKQRVARIGRDLRGGGTRTGAKTEAGKGRRNAIWRHGGLSGSYVARRHHVPKADRLRGRVAFSVLNASGAGGVPRLTGGGRPGSRYSGFSSPASWAMTSRPSVPPAAAIASR